MNDLGTGIFEHEPGPSWARANWPVEALDDLNVGLDPTQATIDKIKAAGYTIEGTARMAGGLSAPFRRSGELGSQPRSEVTSWPPWPPLRSPRPSAADLARKYELLKLHGDGPKKGFHYTFASIATTPSRSPATAACCASIRNGRSP